MYVCMYVCMYVYASLRCSSVSEWPSEEAVVVAMRVGAVQRKGTQSRAQRRRSSPPFAKRQSIKPVDVRGLFAQGILER